MSYFSYSSCITALEDIILYKEKISTELNKNLPENELSKIILEYYDAYEEYSYVSGQKISKK
jgi:hypothetical protein